MKGKSKWALLLALVFVLSVFLSACGGSGSGSGSAKSGNKSTAKSGNGNSSTTKNSGSSKKLAAQQAISFNVSSPIRSLDSTIATDTISFQTIWMIHSGLMTTKGVKGKIVPDLAVGQPKVNSSKTVYTFTIRKDAKWSNGDPVTAQDFVYAWRKLANPKHGSQYAYIMESAHVKNATKVETSKAPVSSLGVKALDAHTLQVTLSQPTPYFLSLMSFPPFFPQNKKFAESKGKNYAQEPSDLLYDGAYTLASWQHGHGWTLKKNPNYWNAKNITMDKVTRTYVPQEPTAVNLYNTGKTDLVALTGAFATKYKNSPDLNKSLNTCVFNMKFNLKKDHFNDVKIRRAFSMAVNRKALMGSILTAGSVPNHSWVPKNFVQLPSSGKDFSTTVSKSKDPYVYYNPTEAKKLWNEAKKADGFKTMTITMLGTNGSLPEKMSIFVQSQLQQNLPGLTVQIKSPTFSNYLSLTAKGDFELADGSGWCPDYKDPMTFLNLMQTGNGQDTGHFSNKQYDSLITKAGTEGANPAKRMQTLVKADQLLLNQVPITPIYQQGTYTLIKPNLKGIVIPIYGPLVDFRYAKLYQK